MLSVGLVCGMATGMGAVGSASGVPAGKGACQTGVLEGEVRAGESFARPIGGGLEVRLDALSWGSGWLLRVQPVRGPRPPHDYAELATPPYASVSPLLLSTDYSFRAQGRCCVEPAALPICGISGAVCADGRDLRALQPDGSAIGRGGERTSRGREQGSRGDTADTGCEAYPRNRQSGPDGCRRSLPL